MATAKILTRAIRFGAAYPLLLVTIEIDCEECGNLVVVLAGHHVQALLQALQEVAEREPELTAPGEIAVVHRSTEHINPGLN